MLDDGDENDDENDDVCDYKDDGEDYYCDDDNDDSIMLCLLIETAHNVMSKLSQIHILIIKLTVLVILHMYESLIHIDQQIVAITVTCTCL